MYPVIHFFGRDIGVYGLCAVIGLLVASFLFYRLTKRIGYPVEKTVFTFLFVAVGVLIGGHFLYGVTQWRLIASLFSPARERGFWDTLVLAFGGSVFYGGLLGSIGALFFAIRKETLPHRLFLADAYAVVVPLFHVIGRVGCFFGGCCYGIESDFGFIVYDNLLNPAVNGVRRFPVALLECLLNLLLFLLLLFFFKKRLFKCRLLLVYLLLYSVIRFSDEFLRGDAIRGFLLGFSLSQWVSAALFLFSAMALSVPAILRHLRRRRR